MQLHPILLAEGDYLQLARLQSMTEWWHWLLLVALCVSVVGAIVVLYYRDSRELPRAMGWLLAALRILAFAGILFYFFDLEKRSQQEVISTSRALLLIDSSQSMGLRDTVDGSTATNRSRAEQVADVLSQGPLIEDLRASHDVVAYRFDEGANPIELATFSRAPRQDSGSDPIAEQDQLRRTMLKRARQTARVAFTLLGVSLLAGLIYALGRRGDAAKEITAWPLLVSALALIAGLVALATANLMSPDLDLQAAMGFRELLPQTAIPEDETGPPKDAGATSSSDEFVWEEALQPHGVETRLGDALRRLVNQERGGPVAGIVVFSDGRSNAGIDYTAAASAAQEAGIPVLTVGLGSDQRPQNVRVADVEAPPRVYPGDNFNLTGYLQAFGLSGKSVKVELFSGAANRNIQQSGQFEQERLVTLPADGQMTPVRFEVTPEEAGRRVYEIRVSAPAEDSEPRDNARQAEVVVVTRKNRVLLVAGGPTREYRFVRNLLYRDEDTTVDVLLQSAKPGISQEADNVVYEFPETADELFEYDALICFDPDWQSLTETQTELLDRWVAEQAGGLVVIAGPVYTPVWANMSRGDRRIDTIKALYPVVFYSRGSAAFNLGDFGSDKAWPLEFTRDGREAEFLWLEEDMLGSEQAWTTFDGVYGYYSVKEAKPGARVFARFSNPDAVVDRQLPVYFAGHFYGAGRVFFAASGEMWRLRAADVSYFERFYTKLIRWVSQGRLLRDSSRGVLLVDKDRCLLGDQVAVRAMLTDSQHEPLMAEEVAAALVDPQGGRSTLTLKRVVDSPRAGMFGGQFTASMEGDYRIEMAPPETSDELLRSSVEARLPDLEIERPERNDALLQDLADKTGGSYFVGTGAVAGGEEGPSLAASLPPQDQITMLPGTPDRQFERRLLTWLMGLISGVLCLEWLLRRLNRLA